MMCELLLCVSNVPEWLAMAGVCSDTCQSSAYVYADTVVVCRKADYCLSNSNISPKIPPFYASFSSYNVLYL